jgi:multiple sugar transport system substrate-binding protein
MKSRLLTIVVSLSIIGGSAVLSPITSARAGGPTEITLALWDEVQKPIIQQAVDVFNKNHRTTIHVTINSTPWSDFWTKLDATLPTSKAPDVTWMNVNVRKYATGGVIEPLDKYIASDAYNMQQYVPGRVAAFQVGTSQYALPKGMDAVFVAYNKAIFAKYGVPLPKKNWTWNDMKTAAAAILAGETAAKKTTEYPIVMELDAQPSWINFLYQDGAGFLSADRKTTNVGTPAGIATIQSLVDLMNAKLMAPYNVLSETKGTDIFLSGNAGMVFIGSWKAAVLEKSTLGAAKNIGLIQMPTRALNNQSVAGGLGYAMAAKSAHKAEAWTFMKYITGHQSMTNEALNGIEFPARADSQGAYAKGFANIDAKVIVAAAKSSFAYPSIGIPATTQPMVDAIAQALSGTVPIATTLQAAAAKSQALLDAFYAVKS